MWHLLCSLPSQQALNPLSFIQRLGTHFAMKDLGDLHFFLEIEAKRTSTALVLTQTKYTLDVLNRTHMQNSKPCPTPLAYGSKLSAYDGAPLSDATEYCSIVGALQYLTLTKPDICYAVNQVCQFMHALTTVHLQAVKRILRYLKGSLGLTITPGPLTTFFSFSDADWAGCPDSRRSTIGFCVFLGKNLLTWVSKKQPTLSRSSAEAEYKALALTTSELLWLSYLLRDLVVPFRYQFLLHCDNASTTHLGANPVFHACSKHIEVDYHFVRDLVVAGKLLIRLVRSNKADIFTKGLPESTFHHFRGKLLSPACPSLERLIG